jgi:hypothetical protein
VRDRRLELAGVATIALAAAAVWTLRHPDSTLVARAAEWPLVGGVARAVRSRYLPPPAVETPAALPAAASGVAPSSHAVARPSAPERARSTPAAAPRAASRELPADGTVPVGPLPGRAADPARLESALARLGSAASRLDVGPYSLWTDVDGAAQLAVRWHRLVAAGEGAWAGRYGVEPVGPPAETIVLYAREAAFRAHAAELGIVAADTSGVTGWGIVALTAEGLDDDELDGGLLHELAHLLARRSLGPALPPWLAEGLAEDFAEAPLGPDGGLDFARVRGVVRHEHNRFEIRGGLAALDRAGQRAARHAPPALARLDGADFAAAGEGLDLYADAFVWIRFLLADVERAAGLRAFLAAVRGGAPPTVAELERRLPRPTAELAPQLATWLLDLRRRELLDHGAPAGLPDERGIVFGRVATELPEG